MVPGGGIVSASLDVMAAELLAKLSAFRWPPPQPDQVRGLLYGYLEQARQRSEAASPDRDEEIRQLKIVHSDSITAVLEQLADARAGNDARWQGVYEAARDAVKAWGEAPDEGKAGDVLVERRICDLEGELFRLEGTTKPRSAEAPPAYVPNAYVKARDEYQARIGNARANWCPVAEVHVSWHDHELCPACLRQERDTLRRERAKP